MSEQTPDIVARAQTDPVVAALLRAGLNMLMDADWDTQARRLMGVCDDDAIIVRALVVMRDANSKLDARRRSEGLGNDN